MSKAGTSRRIAWAAVPLLLIACTRERRGVDVEQPSSPPSAGAPDARMDRYLGNDYQIGQGARYFVWYGCAGCHDGRPGHAIDLAVGPWKHGRSVAETFAFVAHDHPPPSEGSRIPDEQLWQITAYLDHLPSVDPEARFRQANDLAREPKTEPGPATSRPSS